jgi:thiol-disulfide isomerase/thioredoxin
LWSPFSLLEKWVTFDLVSFLGLGVAAVALLVGSALGVVWRRRYGRLVTVAGASAPGAAVDADVVRLPAGLVSPSPDAVTLVHFSSATCRPCRQVAAVCDDVAGDLSGVRHVEIDAERHLDATRELRILRLPTLLIVDRDGRVAKRTVGVPDRASLRRAVSEVMAA